MNRQQPPKQSSAGAFASALLFLAIVYWLGGFGDLLRLLGMVR